MIDKVNEVYKRIADHKRQRDEMEEKLVQVRVRMKSFVIVHNDIENREA